MALAVAKGSFAAPNTTIDVEVNIGWQPKAVLFWLTQQTATGFAAHRNFCIGIAAGTAQFCLAMSAKDNVGVSTEIGSTYRNDFILRAVDCTASNVTVLQQATFSSFDVDGFTIHYTDTAVGREFITHWLAIGGADVTNAWAGEILSPATTPAAVGYSTPGFQPDFVMVLGCGTGTAPRDDLGTKWSLGAASSVADQAVSYWAESNAIPTTLSSVQTTSQLVRVLSFSGVDQTTGALQSFDTNGFTIDWTTVPATQRGYVALALKGGEYKVTTDTQKTSTGTQAKSGLGLTPDGLLMFGTNRASTSATSNALGSFSIGASDGTTEGASWGAGTDNVSTTDENSATVTDKALRHATNPSTTDGEADLQSLDSDGYTLNWTTADATAREFITVAFGNPSGPAPQALRPDADITTTGWTSTPLWSKIEEETPDGTVITGTAS